MTESKPISEEALKHAYTQLSSLAKAEYGQTLTELIAADDPVKGNEYANVDVRDSHDAFWRLGRLVGITVKEPFANEPTPRQPHQPSQTGANRLWDLNPKVLNAEHPDWWQYYLISELLSDTDRVGSFDWLPPPQLPVADQVARFLHDAQTERGVFGVLIKAARPYLCKNPEFRKELAKKGRIEAPRQMIAGGATTGAATLIIEAIPWLGPAAMPVVAGILLIISAKGLDAFCSRTVPSPATGVVET